MNTNEIIPALYKSEINAKIEWFWDGGFNVSLGDDMNGWDAEETLYGWDNALIWLRDRACDLYPDSTFAKQFGEVAA